MNASLNDYSALIKTWWIRIALDIRGIHRPTFENTTAIFAQPRSGSTWLSELVTSTPRTLKVDEPLYRGKLSLDGAMPPKSFGKLNQLDRLNFFYHQPIPKNTEFPEAEKFFFDLFSLKFSNSYLYNETSLTGIPGSRNALFKFCYGNLLLSWLRNRIDFKSIVMHRNPFSVVSSQLRHPAFSHVLKQSSFSIPSFKNDEAYTKYDSILKACTYPEELLTAIWCINYTAVKNLYPDDSLIHVAYEGLLLDPGSEIDRLFQFLKKPIPSLVWNRLTKPSISTKKNDMSRDQQINGWRTELSQDQINRIGDLLVKFECDRYENHIFSDFTFMENNK